VSPRRAGRLERRGWLAAAALSALAAAAPSPSLAHACVTPAAPDEPPCNPALADSPWPAAHRGSYAQDSSPLPGPASAAGLGARHLSLLGIPVILSISGPYGDGGRAVWGTTAGSFEVFKVDEESGALIDELRPSAPGTPQPGGGNGPTTGIYNLVDRDNRLIVGRGTAIEVYGDSVPGDRFSPIALVHRFELPARALCRPSDRLVGLAMLWDGEVAFATQEGMVGGVPRVPARMNDRNLSVYSINGPACDDPQVADSALETISNSIAADERGGIYPVTDRAQYKLLWTGGRLELAWRTPYQSGGAGGGARVDSGSGSTPTLMGVPGQRDRFVVITDGQRLMHLVLMWRGQIPPGWQPIAPGVPRRIACEVRVTFGDPQATASSSEQSVVVRGYAAVVVNNRMAIDDLVSALPSQAKPFTELASNVPGNAPQGIERIDWDPQRQDCEVRWANPDVSMPNGVPAMSSATGLVYGIGQENGIWGLEAVGFRDGARRFFKPTSPSPDENSFFAAATIGPGHAIWTGTFGGVTTFAPSP